MEVMIRDSRRGRLGSVQCEHSSRDVTLDTANDMLMVPKSNSRYLFSTTSVALLIFFITKEV